MKYRGIFVESAGPDGKPGERRSRWVLPEMELLMKVIKNIQVSCINYTETGVLFYLDQFLYSLEKMVSSETMLHKKTNEIDVVRPGIIRVGRVMDGGQEHILKYGAGIA